jgi:hypothetical protein
MRRAFVLVAVIVTSWLGVEARAHAQAAPAPTPQEIWPSHKAWLFEGALHAGALVADCKDQNADCNWDAGGLSGDVGYFLGPRLAVMVDVWGMYHTENHVTIYQVISTVAAQFWATKHLWLKGGLGNAYAGYKYDFVIAAGSDKTETVLGVMLGAGYDIHVTPDWTLDLQVRYGTGAYDSIKGHNTSLALGFNWY